MKRHLIDTGFHSGKYNMQFDLELALSCEDDETFLRFYRWNPFCISLGANQKEDDINAAKAEKDGIDIVKRPTGGRAILHSEELTYSIVTPLKNISSVHTFYEDVNLVLIKGLKSYNEKLNGIYIEKENFDFKNFYSCTESSLCFSSSAKGEIKYRGKKIVGSAQRRLNKTLLQHGSILCGSFHKKVVDYLNTDEQTKAKIKFEMNEKTTEIETVIEKKVDYEKLSKLLAEEFEESLNLELVLEGTEL